jgi:hypothetical protein
MFKRDGVVAVGAAFTAGNLGRLIVTVLSAGAWLAWTNDVEGFVVPFIAGAVVGRWWTLWVPVACIVVLVVGAVGQDAGEVGEHNGWTLLLVLASVYAVFQALGIAAHKTARLLARRRRVRVA